MAGRIQIIQGGQYGSEAKGAIAAHLCVKEKVNIAVRTGASNAGHTVYYDGKPYAMQQMPVGWVNPNTALVIGAGALVDIAVLEREIKEVSAATGTDITARLFIDPRAYAHLREHGQRSTQANRHHLIGATGKGCSEALTDRVRQRGLKDFTLRNWLKSKDSVLESRFTDTEEMLNRAYNSGALIQLEGTQGTLLDLVLGPYPRVTHKQTGPAQWMMEAGLSPALQTDIVMVVRTMPIRVAGDSGPLPKETSWPIVARNINNYRASYGLPSIVDEKALVSFEEAARWLAKSDRYVIPTGSDGLDQHKWSDADRTRCRVALSEFNRDVLGMLDPLLQMELFKLFEKTTVTKKLRRVADLDMDSIRTAARQVRPHRVAVTFMNYVFPEMWCRVDHGAITHKEQMYLATLQGQCRAPVTITNYGPLPEHICDLAG